MSTIALIVFAFSGSLMSFLLWLGAGALYGYHRVRASNERRAADPAV